MVVFSWLRMLRTCATHCKSLHHCFPLCPLTFSSGGMGLTGGIIDVGGLSDCLAGIHRGKADDSILDKYSEIRSEKFRTLSDPISSENLRRLWKNPETAGDEDGFLLALKRAAVDKEFSKEFQKVNFQRDSPNVNHADAFRFRVSTLYSMTSLSTTMTMSRNQRSPRRQGTRPSLTVRRQTTLRSQRLLNDFLSLLM